MSVDGNRRQFEDYVRNGITELLTRQDTSRTSSDGAQILMRCFFCGDSVSDSEARSLGFKVMVDEDTPYLYQCFRIGCGASGKIDEDILARLGNTDVDLEVAITERNRHTKGYVRNGNGRFNASRFRRELSNVVVDNEETRIKLNYLSDRLGVDMTPDLARRLKVVPDMLRVMKVNGIELPSDKRMKWKYEQVSKYSIGFISMYNDLFIMRDVTNGTRLRNKYDNIPIFKRNIGNSMKGYVLPVNYDLLYNGKSIIHVSEGIISILGVYLSGIYRYEEHGGSGHDGPVQNEIFMGACGMGIYSIVKEMITSLCIIDGDIHVWKDSEVPVWKYHEMIKLVEYIPSLSLYVHSNRISDDFGHPAGEIDVETVCLVYEGEVRIDLNKGWKKKNKSLINKKR